jgi:hypothetical protein
VGELVGVNDGVRVAVVEALGVAVRVIVDEADCDALGIGLGLLNEEYVVI